MVKAIVSFEPDVYKMLPDIATCDNGSIVCVYRESLIHGRWPFTRIVAQISCDEGLNWGEKSVIHAHEDYARDGGWNTPRLLHLGDGRLLMICDWGPPNEPEYTPHSEIFQFHSNDGGVSWDDMHGTGIKGRICPCIFKTSTGMILIGADGWDGTTWSFDMWASEDEGASWSGPVTIASSTELWLNEGTFVELDDGTLVSYIREDKERRWAYKALSTDGGETWAGPYPTNLLSCVGRPQAGKLRSGEIAVVYGFGSAPRLLVLHVEDQEAAADPQCVQNQAGSHLMPTYRRFFVEHDRSIHPDGAYCGWVQLPNGDLFVVQYIVDDAPTAHLRSYSINRRDWILCPEGKILSVDTRKYKKALYHLQALEASTELHAKGREK